MTTLRTAAQQALEALECVDLQSLVPDYGSGHYSVARLDGPNIKAAITALRAALAEDAMQKFTDVNQELEAALAEPQTWVCPDSAEHRYQKPGHCEDCGKTLVQVAKPVQDTGVKLKPVFYAPRRLDDEEIEDIIKRNAAITESILDINFKEPQPGMVNLDAFRAFHFNDPPKGGFVGEIEMLKWLVRNRDGDYWKAKHGVQEPPCATRECMPSECPNCASLQDQNTELDRKLAEMEQTSLELCETCGWRTLIPGDCCLNCVRQQPKA